MPESKTLILIDGHALAFREYFALERTGMKTSSGTPSWAVYGFFKAIFDLLKNDKLCADAIGVAFDVSHHTFRTDSYSEYKANREQMPDEMQIQMGLIYEGLEAFNIPIYTKEGFEADDVIGTISKRACNLGHKVLILTGDQDSFQLIDKDGCVKVVIPSKGDLKEYGWQDVYDKLSVYPNQIIDYKALRGDLSDNIPGITGIGEKTAVKLLSEFGTLDNVLANVDSISGNSVREKIKNGVEQAKLSQFLATIVTDVDVPFDFEKTNIELPDISCVTEFFRKMQFYSFLKNIESILKTFDRKSCSDSSNATLKTPRDLIPVSNDNGQLGLFAQAVQSEINKVEYDAKSKIITDSQDLQDLVKNLESKNVICLNVFANEVSPVDFEVYGFAFGVNDNFRFDKTLQVGDENSQTNVFYIPVKHNIENQLDLKQVMSELSKVLESDNVKKIVHDSKYLYNLFSEYGICLNGLVFDTVLASYVKDSNASSEFDVQCMERINHILPTLLTSNKNLKFSDLNISDVKNYVEDYISSMFVLTQYWHNSLSEKDKSILYDIELPLSKVLSMMEINGVCIDTKYLTELSDDFDSKLKHLETRIFSIAGEGFNINSPKQVGEILYNKLEIKSPKRGKSKNSTSAEVLNLLAQDYEIASLILEYRKFSKLKSTYTDALPLLISKKDNRIHTTYNQTATTTGRLSSSNPNLQNIPARTEEGNKIRKAFVPQNREDYLILSADYSQIELRLLAHVSEDKNLIEAFNSGIDVHTLTASKVFGIPVNEVTKAMRYKSKAVNFGIIYGQTKYGLAKSLKISVEDAQTFIDKYLETYPKIKLYMDSMVEFVEKKGYVETIFGRRRYLSNEINSSNGMIREFAKRAAINHPMQGSSADLIKIAMIDFAKKMKDNNLKSKLIIQVHDELVVEVLKSELDIVKKLILESMELNQPLRVPLVVDINTGETWKEL